MEFDHDGSLRTLEGKKIAFLHSFSFIYMYVRACVHVCTQACVSACKYVCTCMH